ncbi:hypothetical protein EYF80_029995 [Liparis tanakae]|uniref:Uncharacterized protein n=1 Tax=Liparis tanakae TaxID=230148 RepID=A0A4Z2H2W1_9TELE|nr:hypothetical protein EYF80_029995 [Liparis tanakae]
MSSSSTPEKCSRHGEGGGGLTTQCCTVEGDIKALLNAFFRYVLSKAEFSKAVTPCCDCFLCHHNALGSPALRKQLALTWSGQTGGAGAGVTNRLLSLAHLSLGLAATGLRAATALSESHNHGAS